MDASTAASPRLGRWLDEAERLDVGVYAAIARTSTPAIDRAMSRLSRAADYSRLSLGSAAVLAVAGRARRPPGGRDRARVGCGHGDRRQPDCQAARPSPPSRPDRAGGSPRPPGSHAGLQLVPVRALGRGVCVRDRSRSRLPLLWLPPYSGLAALVAYSRVHTGVHYPGDVVAGSLLGIALAEATARSLDGRLR